jgi:uncharacterized protein
MQHAVRIPCEPKNAATIALAEQGGRWDDTRRGNNPDRLRRTFLLSRHPHGHIFQRPRIMETRMLHRPRRRLFLLRSLPFVAAFAAVLLLGTAMTASAQKTAASDGTLLTISADARASRVPDVATLSTGVVTQAADANAALRANAEQMNKVMAAIKAAGTAERDIRTSGISIYPQYRYAENQPPVITGYQASNTVDIKVREIAKLGKVLDALVASGANQVNGPSFEIDQPDEAYDEARRSALKKAQDRAEMYAKALGMKVRRIVSIQDGAAASPPGPMPMMKMAAMEADSTPVSPGESTLSATVTVMFELAP